MKWLGEVTSTTAPRLFFVKVTSQVRLSEVMVMWLLYDVLVMWQLCKVLEIWLLWKVLVMWLLCEVLVMWLVCQICVTFRYSGTLTERPSIKSTKAVLKQM